MNEFPSPLSNPQGDLEPFDFSLYRDDFEYIKQKLRRTNKKQKEEVEDRPINNFDFSPYKTDFDFIIQHLKDQNNFPRNTPVINNPVQKFVDSNQYSEFDTLITVYSDDSSDDEKTSEEG
eukprot:TRINITY_DN13217_c0_g1_i1.p1 TRINITY_DN13217_c0_g1~~TRINITY_DN13217_c0_g1_i1.p1  ORF type:complete len:120 (-),score=36.06 TRINITY_DN13217_c0_g1_i1:368-727(-)